MKIYIAASYPNKEKVLNLGVTLEANGHEIVSGWIFKDEGYTSDDIVETEVQKFGRMQVAAIRDFEDIRKCDMLIHLTDGENQLTHGGRHTELGIALALEKKVAVIGKLEQVFHYYHLLRYKDVSDFLYSFLESYGT